MSRVLSRWVRSVTFIQWLNVESHERDVTQPRHFLLALGLRCNFAQESDILLVDILMLMCDPDDDDDERRAY